MPVVLEEALRNHLSLMEENKFLDASIELTKAIRELFLVEENICNSELFRTMILCERKNIEERAANEVGSSRVEYLFKKKEVGNVIFSNLNTFLLLKCKKAGFIELPDSPMNLLKTEGLFLNRSLWSMRMNDLMVSLYSGETDSKTEMLNLLNLVSINIQEFVNIEEVVRNNDSLITYETMILNELEDSEEGSPLNWFLYSGFSLALLNWYLGRMEEFRYMLMKIAGYISENNEIYWSIKFLDKEYLQVEQ